MLNLGVTVKLPCTESLSVAVKVALSPSLMASTFIRIKLFNCTFAVSSFLMVPMASSSSFTATSLFSSDNANWTLKVSSCSTTPSSLVFTLKVCFSPFVPAKVSFLLSCVPLTKSLLS